jgi:hypothetical protein
VADSVVAALVAGGVSLVVGGLTALATAWKFQQDNLALFQAERVARELMMDSEWRWRSFDVIKHHLGGFEDDELRKILVRAGAIRTKSEDGKEVWGLLDRVRKDAGMLRLTTKVGHRYENPL